MTRPGSPLDVEDVIFTYVSATPTNPAPAFITCTTKVPPVLTMCLARPWAQGTEL